MIIVLQSSGKVAVNDNGTVKIADTSPLPSGCCCGGTPCTNCSGSTPSQWQVEFTGVAEGTCGNCNSFNTTAFILTQYSACEWRVSFAFCWPLTAATEGYVRVSVEPTQVIVDVVYTFGGIPAPARFRHSGAVSCEAVLNPTFLFQSGSVNCAFSGATCTATPL